MQCVEWPIVKNAFLASGPVIITCRAITSGSLSYQFSKTVTKRIIEDLIHAVRVHAFIMHQRIKLASHSFAFAIDASMTASARIYRRER
jgi:hypothetical protein